jgi:hypothetical protein
MAVSLTLSLISNFIQATLPCVLAAVFSVGLTMVLCPFCTPQTVELLGLRRSLIIARIAGVLFLMVVLGLSIAFFLGHH